MPEDTSNNTKPRSLWRWLRRGALAFLVLLVVALGSGWLSLERDAWKGRTELAATIAETDKEDPRWRWDDIQEDIPAVPDGENSLLVVKQVVDSLGGWKPGELKLPDERPLFDANHPSNRRLDEQRLVAIRKELSGHEAIMTKATSLKDFPRGRHDVHLDPDFISTPLPHAQPVREVSFLLTLDVERLAHAGSTEQACNRIQAIFNAAAGLRDDYFLISQLVRIACRFIAVARIERLLGMMQLSDQECAKLCSLVSAERKENILLVGLRGERAGWHHFYDNVEKGRISLPKVMSDVGGGSADLLTRMGLFLYSYRVPEDHAASLRWFNRTCEVAKLPPWERAAGWAKLHAEISDAKAKALLEKRLVLFALLTPAVNKVNQASDRDQACLASAEAALAVERFRLANKRWPKSLNELCPAFLPSVPLDPFTGKPLLYGKRDDGVAIYSVGPDLQDDGGNILRPLPEGNHDLGFRLFDPDKRGLPPLAQKDAEQPGNARP